MLKKRNKERIDKIRGIGQKRKKRWECYEKKKAAAAYLHKPLQAHYCQRCSVSLPGSGWIWVGPLRSCHDFLLCFLRSLLLLCRSTPKNEYRNVAFYGYLLVTSRKFLYLTRILLCVISYSLLVTSSSSLFTVFESVIRFLISQIDLMRVREALDH